MTSAIDSDYGFLFVSRRRIPSIFNRFDAISAFSLIDNGGLLTSLARDALNINDITIRFVDHDFF